MAAQQIGLEAILETDKWQKGVKTYLTGLDKMQKETSGFDGKMAAFGKKGIDSLQTLGKAALGASVAIAAAGAAAGVAIGKFVVSGISKAADLESQMSRIAATLNTTREAAQPLKDLIMQLALDPKLVVTTNEAADAIENLAKNGVSMKDILDGVARSVVLLANSTGAEFGAAADVVTDVMAQFNLTAADTEHAVNQITGVTNLSKLTFEDYALAIAQAGGMAGMVGVSFEDFNSVLIATNANFAGGSDLGTSFKNFLATLPGKSDKAKDAIKALGLEFFDANGQLKSMAEISEQLHQVFLDEVTFTSQVNNMTAEQTQQKKLLEQQLQRTGGQLFLYQAGVNGVGESEEANAEAVAKLNEQYDAAMTAYEGLATNLGTTVTVRRQLTEAERIAYGQTIFGVDSIRLALGMAEAGAVAYTDMAEATKALGLEGKQLEVAQKSLATAFEDGKITFFEFGTAQAAAIDASAQAAERMRNFKGVMDILKGAIEGLQIMIGDAFLPILTTLAQKAVELTSAYGPSLIKPFQDFGAAVSTFFTEIEEGEAPLTAFKDAMATFGTKGTEAANAMISVGLAVGGVLFAVNLVVQPIADLVDDFVEWKDVAIVLGSAIATVVVPAIWGMIAAIAPLLLTLGVAILAVAGLRTAWENDWLGIKTKSIEAITAIQDAFEPFTTAVREHLTGALTEVKNFTAGNETEWTHTEAIWEGAKESVTNLFSSIVGTVLLNYPIWWAALQTWGFAAGQWIVDAATAVSTHIATYTAALLTEIGTKLEEWKTKLTEWSAAAGEWLTTASAEVGTKLDEWYTALSSALGGKLASWMTAFDEWTTEAWNWLVTAAGLVGAQIDAWYTSLSTALSGKLATWKTAFVEWTTELSAWIAKSTTLVTTGIGTWYTSLSTAVNAKLPTFTTAMLKWATALVKWIGDTSANALPELGKWLGKILAWAPTGATLLATGMLKMATALVGWIGSTSADALPKLGTWLGKVTGWIIGTGVPALVVGVAELAKALVGWISGTGGVAVESSAQGQLNAEFEKFKTALSTAITNMWEGIKGFVQNFGQSFWDELGKNIDWLALGMTITSGIQSGVETVSGTLIIAFQTMAKNALDKITSVDWNAAGANIIRGVRDGMQSMVGTIISKVLSIVNEIVNGFKKAVDRVKQIGRDIINGLISGIAAMKDKLIAKITEMANLIPQWMKDALGIKSPSRVMIKIGADTMRGFLVGLETGSVRLVEMAEQITRTFTNTILKGTERAVDAFANILDGWSSVGGGFADSMQEALDSVTESFNNMLATGTGTGAQQFDMIRLMDQLQSGIGKYQQNNRVLDTLKQQAELIDLIRETGGQPATVLAGIALGRDADPQQLLDVVNRMMEVFNGRLEKSILIASQGFQELVDSLRKNRRSLEQIEAQFADAKLDQLERYRREVTRLDEQIAAKEQSILVTGDTSELYHIQSLNTLRERTLDSIKRFLEQRQQIEAKLAQMPTFRGERAQAGADAFRERFIDPLVASFDQMSVEMRSSTLTQIDRYLGMLREFSAWMDHAAAAEKHARKATEGFGEGAQQRIENLLAIIYDVGTPTASRANAIQSLREFAAALNTIRSELTTRTAGREDVAGVIERATGGFDQLSAYKTALADLDKQIATLTNTIEETGNVNLLPQLRSFDTKRQLSVDELKNFLVQVSQLEGAFRDIKNLTGPGETSAQRFVDEQIQPILDAFSAPMRPQDRQAWLYAAQQRVAIVNKFIDQMRAVEKLQQRIATQEGFSHLADEFASMTDIAMPEAQRVALLNQLTLYITQMERLFALQKDIAVGVGADPLVERFKNERLDTIAKQLENINLSEAERLRLIEQYRMEQEKILAIQTKQNQLEFLQQQLSLLDKLKQLGTEEGFKVDVPNIIKGIGFGVNASLDDLLLLVGKVIDETVRFTNFKLGIKSPSKVFAEIGGYMMQGLAKGIESTMMRPINSLSGAISELPYALGGRSLTLNMGGVNISNGMDEVMFEARVRQILDRAFP